MREAGIDVGIFKAYSTWGVASSAAKDRPKDIKSYGYLC